MRWKTAGPRDIPQAFPYQGSKRILASQILSLIPDGGVPLLVEPFAGSAAISVGARLYGLADMVAISDVNGPLMELWKCIIKDPNALLARYETMWHEQQEGPGTSSENAKTYFIARRKEFNATQDPALLLYLLARIVKAAVRYGKGGEFNQSADNRRLGAKPSNMRERINIASALLAGHVEISTESYEHPLIDAPTDAVVYMDPPYQGTTDVPDHRYLNGLKYDAFSKSLQAAVDNDVSFIVSYDVVRDDNKYGQPLPASIGLLHRNVLVGPSSQATLLGRSEQSIESLYLSPALVDRLGGADKIDGLLNVAPEDQPALF
ncbi:DNA adenine methylase [Mycobacteroides abscessus]|uniref:DNA adenine methylase n=1 Tax=Mycobacteroides abscessus TaxID=36809 RepID=UPI000929BC54|nr:DNA adenine methylase [Mycobacteroides abscessus]SIC59603.1 Modification methylase FokI [Mycobacteroides abscessus subsp. abscessus]